MKTVARRNLCLWVMCCLVALAMPAWASVEPTAEGWLIRSGSRTVTLNATNLVVTLADGSNSWQTLPSTTDDLGIRCDGSNTSHALIQAERREIRPFKTGYSDGLRIHLSGFPRANGGLDLALTLSVSLERDTGEVVFEVAATEKTATVRGLRWPRGFVPGLADHTVVPFMQGMLLPAKWPRKVFLYDTLSYGRGLYMPWWGHQKGNAAVMVILETPDDAGCVFEHPAGGPTRIEPRWVHSLGRFGYPRRLRVCLFEQGGYVEMAARYRSHAIANGTLVTLKEKFARNPIASRLVGAPVVHTGILNHIEPDSSYYKKDDPSANHQLTTFDQRAGDLHRLYEAGVKRAYVHLDGWGRRGYDNLHPDILPPGAEAGGWEGLRRFADTCEQLGYLFAVHDQYRDFYHDADSYSDDLTVIEENGSRPFMKIWWGGKQSILCSSFAPGYVARNHRQILAQGVKLKGAYLDVFAVVPGDECYNPDHAVTRGESLRYRGQSFDVIRSLEGVVSSEEPADWAMRYLHLVHHGPFALDPNPGKGPAMGVPIPLHSLVYHDALVVPWSLSRGGWGIPDDDLGFLHALLNAGVPYVAFGPDAAHLQQVREVCALHKRLALVPLVRHEFLRADFRKQKSIFADGTVVEVDFADGTHRIVPPLTKKELEVLSTRYDAAAK